MNNWKTGDDCTWPDVWLCVQRGLRSLEQRKKTLAWSRQGRLLGRESLRWGTEGLSSGELATGGSGIWAGDEVWAGRRCTFAPRGHPRMGASEQLVHTGSLQGDGLQC